MEIQFFKPSGPNGFLSNYLRYRFRLGCRQWDSVEHFYQASKFSHFPDLEEKVRRLPDPDAAKGFTRERIHLWRADWLEVRNRVMWEAIRAKFGQSGFLTRELLLTGDARLCEVSPFDSYWGSGPDGLGLNRLGRMLMHLRHRLKRDSEDPAAH